MGKFRVGDVAIAVCPAGKPDRFGMHGQEVIVIRPLRRRWMETAHEHRVCYEVQHSSGKYRALPEWLRRKEDKIEWSDCVFQPEHAHTSSEVASEKP